jgi:hypothetical protein
VKVSNLCPYAGNEAWCAYDTNSFGYDAHFDLMDYNMNGLISSMGWNNPEVTYEEVDCAANGYTDWNCQCASATSSSCATAAPTAASTPAPTANAATSAPTAKAATSAPTAKAATAAPTAKPPAKAATSAPVAPTTAPAPAATSAPVAPVAGSIKIQVNSGSNQYWFGFSVVSSISNIVSVDVMTSGSTSWTRMNFEGNQYWNMYSFAPSSPISAPISLRFNGANGSVIANNIVTSFQQSSTVDTGVSV